MLRRGAFASFDRNVSSPAWLALAFMPRGFCLGGWECSSARGIVALPHYVGVRLSAAAWRESGIGGQLWHGEALLSSFWETSALGRRRPDVSSK